MRIRSVVNPVQLQRLVEQNYDAMPEIEQKFLVNMLVQIDVDGKISPRQIQWLNSLVTKMQRLNQLRERRPQRSQRVNHDNHEVEVRPGSGPHAARLWCVKCNKHIQWITRDQNSLLTMKN